MRRKIDTVILSVMVVLALSCGGRTAGTGTKKVFPGVTVPAVYSDPVQRADYLAGHYWDNLDRLDPGGSEAEQAVSNFIGILYELPLDRAQDAVRKLFARIGEVELADTSRHTYTLMTQLVSRYLYDPNSPLRNEDFYLPFVSAMAESPLTAEDMRQAYRFEAEGCAINQFGSIAPDFVIKRLDGSVFTLHSVQAERIMLFFSNPGCTACKEIIEQVMGSRDALEALSSGRLAVVNVYIDEDLQAWREYEHNYPSMWKTGYDLRHIIRNERIYDVRAIPSLYLLDGEKRILMKDAPVERVLDSLAAGEISASE